MTTKPVAIITGGSRGIGAATAIRFAREGYAICINYKSNTQAAQNTLDEVVKFGVPCITVKANVANEQEVSQLFSTVDAQLGTVSVLVNNVGILSAQSSIEGLTGQRINEILTTNVTSYFLCCREAVKRMAFKYGGSGGAIVNVSSGAAKSGSPNEYIDYAASKGAVDTLTIGLSKEVAAEGIRVNCVRPGIIYTDIHADGGEPGRVDRIKSRLPMKRGGQPSEVAEAIYWFASEQASFSTGAFLDVAGGS